MKLYHRTQTKPLPSEHLQIGQVDVQPHHTSPPLEYGPHALNEPCNNLLDKVEATRIGLPSRSKRLRKTYMGLTSLDPGRQNLPRELVQ